MALQKEWTFVLESESVRIYIGHPGEHGRKKRSNNIYDLKNKTGTTPDSIYMELTAFEQEFHLDFLVDNSFISPYLIVQKGNISWLESYSSGVSDSDSSTSGCIYTGTVHKQSDAPAVANLCGGSDEMVSSYQPVRSSIH